MRRPLFLTLALGAVLALVLSACGSSSSSAPANPLQTTLSYFPSQTPFVLTVATKPSAQAASEEQQLQARLPVLGLGRAALISRLAQLGVNYNQDLKPLAGNPVAIGDPNPSIQAFRNEFLIVWMAKDASKLNALLKKLGGLTAAGSHDGAKLYRASSAALAVTGATILFSKSMADVTAALDRHEHGGGLTSSQYSNAVSGLPQDAAIHIFGDLTAALSTPQEAKARRIPWVAALRSYGATLGYSSSGLTIQFRLDTGGRTLTPSQVPLATGSTPANVVSGLPVQVGLVNPSQIFSFIEGAEQATSPLSYAKFLKQQAVVRRRTGIDINTLIAQFQGDLVMDSDTHTTLGRAGLRDPASVTRVLAKLASAKGGLGTGPSLQSLGGGLYTFQPPGRRVLFTVSANQLVFGFAAAGRQMQASTLRSFAAAPSAPLPGASGALSFRISLSQLLSLTAGAQTATPLARQILGLLGDFSGSVAAAPSALTGKATLAIK
jgi:hypothetical protein